MRCPQPSALLIWHDVGVNVVKFRKLIPSTNSVWQVYHRLNAVSTHGQIESLVWLVGGRIQVSSRLHSKGIGISSSQNRAHYTRAPAAIRANSRSGVG